MSNFTRLNPHVFLNAVTSAISSSWYPVDWRWGGVQQRSISGTKTADDIIVLELQTIANGVTVIATATTFGSAGTDFSAVVQGPFQMIRVRKVLEHGPATVVGFV